MHIEFKNLNEAELEDLRQLANHNKGKSMLIITKKAFDGEMLAKMAITAAEVAAAIINLASAWIGARADKKQQKSDQKPSENDNGISSATIIFTYPDGSKLEIDLEKSTPESIVKCLSIIRQDVCK